MANDPSESVDDPSRNAGDPVEALADLDRGHFVRLTLADGTTVEARVNQFDYVPDERLRLELSTDESGDYGRYQARARAEGGVWSPVEVRRYDLDVGEGEGDWTSLGDVSEVTPLEEHRTMESEEETGHEG